YRALPAEQRIPALDEFFAITTNSDDEALRKRIDSLYADTQLDDEATRLAWMDKEVSNFRESEDPFIRYAVATQDARMAIEHEQEELEGLMQKWRSRYMEAVVNFKRSRGEPIYADANGTLR